MNGDTVFSVRYQAHVCNPPVGLVVKAIVTDSNAFAVFARSGIMDDDGEFTPLLDVILTRAQHESDDRLSKLESGNDIFVEIMGKRFELGDTRISAVALLRSESEYNTQNIAALNIDKEPLAFVKHVDGMFPIAQGLKFDGQTHIEAADLHYEDDEDDTNDSDDVENDIGIEDNEEGDDDDDDDDDDEEGGRVLSEFESDVDEDVDEEDEDDDDDDDDDNDDDSGRVKKRVQ
jgi:hypothetical protein